MKTRKKLKRIEVAAMADMTRREARVTNRLMNDLVERHHMCVDCAINMAVMFVKSRRPVQHVPLIPFLRTRLCSDACCEAFREFCEEMDVKLVPVDGPPSPTQ
jgi:ribosomal protein S26